MTAPTRAHVAVCLESMWDAMIDLSLIGIILCIRLRDTFGDDQRVALLVT